MTDQPLIRCEGLVHVYPDGTRALDGVDLEIGGGERIALTGPNGAGKTTLVRHWNGLLRPTEGTVSLGGTPTAGRHVAELARSVAISFQDPAAQLFAATCHAEVAFGARNAGLEGDELARAVHDALELVWLTGEVRTNPYDLGPSRRRLLTMACVVAMGTPAIVLDEPTAGLDVSQVEIVRTMIDELASVGRTVVAITHDTRLLEGATFARRIRMDAGRIAVDSVA
jgi:energy-coupling factor transporter ATP-binding protein EcfA2